MNLARATVHSFVPSSLRALARASVPALAIALALCAGSCNSAPKNPPLWVETTAAAPTDNVLWELALLAIDQHGFTIGAGANPSTMTAITAWKNSLAPFKGDGYRERVHVKLEPAEGGRYKISLHVERQTNENLARPMDLRYAEWEPAADNEALAKILISKIDARIGEELTIGAAKPKPSRP